MINQPDVSHLLYIVCMYLYICIILTDLAPDVMRALWERVAGRRRL